MLRSLLLALVLATAAPAADITITFTPAQAARLDRVIAYYKNAHQWAEDTTLTRRQMLRVILFGKVRDRSGARDGTFNEWHQRARHAARREANETQKPEDTWTFSAPPSRPTTGGSP